MPRVTRRSLLKTTMAAASASALHGLLRGSKPFSRVVGANDEVRIGIVGFNSHGRTHIQGYQAIPKGVRIVALCDADSEVILRGVRDFFNGRGEKVDTYSDIRKLLERNDIDAISGATPNHWHALSTVWACQAGKDVCVEKPVSHGVWEGRKMVEAARKYGRMVQADLDRRSEPGAMLALEFVREGNLGRILRAHSFVYKRRESIGRLASPVPPPATVDYDLWSGAARMLPVLREKFHYDWHWLWEYGGGEAANNGPHTLDVVRHGLGYLGLPKRVMAFGGRFGYDDAGETPNTQVAILDYEPAPIYFEVRGLPRRSGDNLMDANHMESSSGAPIQVGEEHTGTNNGAVVICEHGFVEGDTAYDNDGKILKRFVGEGIGHHERFVNAVRSRKQDDLRVDILEGHLSTSLCHLANIAWRVGEPASPEEVKRALEGDAIALGIYERYHAHLAANGVDLKKTQSLLGPWMDFDSDQERFVGGAAAEKANGLLKRTYREPFVIPDNV